MFSPTTSYEYSACVKDALHIELVVHLTTWVLVKIFNDAPELVNMREATSGMHSKIKIDRLW